MQSEVLPSPNIRELTKSELAAVEKKIDKLCEVYDFEGIAKLIEIYPLPVTYLDDLKKHWGMEFLLRNKVNLIEAVKKYGISWISS